MQPSSVNFGRWLDRLGFKRLEQPPIANTVQPVMLVADASQLVSPALDCSGIVGGTQAGVVGEESTFLFVASTPVWIEVRFVSATLAQEVYFRTGLAGVAIPVVNAPVVLTPQYFSLNGGDRLRVTRGTQAPAFTNDLPVVRMPGNNSGTLVPRLFVPAGGWVSVSANPPNVILEIAAWFYEMPNEQAQ